MKAFFALATVDQAYAVLERFPPLSTERVDSRSAGGRVVAESVCAREDVPAFRRANMDGYALRAADTGGASETAPVALRVIGTVEMGTAAALEVEPGSAVRVATGAMLPAGADTVVPWELTELVEDDHVLLRAPATHSQNIVEIAEDVAAGEVLFEPGRRLRGGDVGALTGIGHTQVTVFRRPRVAVIATGNEIVEPEAALGPGQVRNVNEYALAALARSVGAEVRQYGVIRDQAASLTATLRAAVTSADVVLISGGSSKGERDLTRATIESLAGEILLHGIAMAPGKPTIIARVGDCAVMGLPGNPAAAVVVFTLFGATLVRVREGEPLARIRALAPRRIARLTAAVTATVGRETYVRVRLVTRTDGGCQAEPLPGKSVAISTVARADGLLRVPADERFEAGSEVEVLLL